MKKVMMILFAAVAMTGTVFAELAPEQARHLFNEAEGYFKQAGGIEGEDPEQAKALYRKAVMRFERIVKEGGVANGGLYYNIGNTYYRMGDLGRAIVNYRRAERYLEGDLNLQQNLKTARVRQKDALSEADDASKLKDVFLFWHYDIAADVRFALFAFFFCLFWAALVVKIYAKKAIPVPPLALLAGLALLFGGSLGWDAYTVGAGKDGVVVSTEVIARKGDGTHYQPSFKSELHAGLEFRLLDQRPEWWQIELADKRTCWIPASAGELIWKK